MALHVQRTATLSPSAIMSSSAFPGQVICSVSGMIIPESIATPRTVEHHCAWPSAKMKVKPGADTELLREILTVGIAIRRLHS